MATQKPVTVTYHPTNPPNQQLQADPPTLTITEPDEWASWILSETSPQLPEDSEIYIHFENRLGPFQAVRNVRPQILVAKGNTGITGSSSYFLALRSPGQDPDSPVLHPSGPFTVDNQCSVVNTSPRTTVTYIPGSETPNGQPALHVDPMHLLLHEGDTALWHIENLPADHFLAFELQPHLFSKVFLGHTAESTRRFGGAVFDDVMVQTRRYRVVVWDAAGGPPAVKDPSIDSLGRPPGT
jgi:hypothetical protein